MDYSAFADPDVLLDEYMPRIVDVIARPHAIDRLIDIRGDFRAECLANDLAAEGDGAWDMMLAIARHLVACEVQELW